MWYRVCNVQLLEKRALAEHVPAKVIDIASRSGTLEERRLRFQAMANAGPSCNKTCPRASCGVTSSRALEI